jgi:hypothetical protein
MAYIDDFEIKHLKKGKFGPLDVYPQEEKQKEVETTLKYNKELNMNNKFKYSTIFRTN